VPNTAQTARTINQAARVCNDEVDGGHARANAPGKVARRQHPLLVDLAVGDLRIHALDAAQHIVVAERAVPREVMTSNKHDQRSSSVHSVMPLLEMC